MAVTLVAIESRHIENVTYYRLTKFEGHGMVDRATYLGTKNFPLTAEQVEEYRTAETQQPEPLQA